MCCLRTVVAHGRNLVRLLAAVAYLLPGSRPALSGLAYSELDDVSMQVRPWP
jgi:hypothetical protein